MFSAFDGGRFSWFRATPFVLLSLRHGLFGLTLQLSGILVPFVKSPLPFIAPPLGIIRPQAPISLCGPYFFAPFLPPSIIPRNNRTFCLTLGWTSGKWGEVGGTPPLQGILVGEGWVKWPVGGGGCKDWADTKSGKKRVLKLFCRSKLPSWFWYFLAYPKEMEIFCILCPTMLPSSILACEPNRHANIQPLSPFLLLSPLYHFSIYTFYPVKMWRKSSWFFLRIAYLGVHKIPDF